MKLEVLHGAFGYSKRNLLFEDVCFSLEQGQILSVLGQNGVGKTTLLKCVTGLLPWSSGEVRIDGERLTGRSLCNEMAYVPQAKGNAPAFTVLDMVCMGRTKRRPFYAMPTEKDWEVSLQCIARMGLAGLEHRLCSQLSGGQLQLVYVARALASEPRMLLLDEPEAHLDFKNQRQMMHQIAALAASGEVGCMINTHHPDTALAFSDLTLMLGRHDYVFGETAQVMNPAHIRRFFDVESYLIDLRDRQIDKQALVFI